MMNKKINYLLLVSSFILFLFNIGKADTVTWLGNDAPWEDPNQWDTGKVPKGGDDVIIPAGRAKLYAGHTGKMRSLEIQTGAIVNVYAGAVLYIYELQNQVALRNEGRINIFGELSIFNIISPGTTTNAHAILNRNDFYVYTSGVVTIEGITDQAIVNQANAYFRSQGEINLSNLQTTAISNDDASYIRNWGLIMIEDISSSPSTYAISNTGKIRNESSGKITMDADIRGGISSSGKLYNRGTIFAKVSRIGLSNSDLFINYAGAIFETEGARAGLLNLESSEVRNYGELKLKWGYMALTNRGLFKNYNRFISEANFRGLGENQATGRWHNHAYVTEYWTNNTNDAFLNAGIAVNEESGTMEINRRFRIATNGTFTNRGIIWSDHSGVHLIYGNFNNEGAIDDNSGTLRDEINNYELIVAPIDEPMYVNVPFANVLDLYQNSFPDHYIVESNWYAAPMVGTSVGYYNGTDFTPNQNAVGLSTIYIGIVNIHTGLVRYFSLEITDGIYPAPSSIVQNPNAEIKPDLTTSTVTLFPNPSTGTVRLQSKLWAEKITQVEVYNSLGQLVQNESIAKGTELHQLNLSASLSNGVYVIRFVQNGKTITSERLTLQGR